MKEKGPLTILAREAFLTASYASLAVLRIALLGKWAEKVVGYLGSFPVEISTHTLSVSLIYDFQFITHYF